MTGQTAARRAAIVKLINEGNIANQRDLAVALAEAGYPATQATVSRDLKALRVAKSPAPDGGARYTVGGERGTGIKYGEIFANSVIKAECALNDVVIKCHPGMAQGACAALDSMFGGLMLGTLAGDDTILAVTADSEQALALTEKIRALLR